MKIRNHIARMYQGIKQGAVSIIQNFVGNAQALKQIEMVETSLKDNAKVILTDKGITPTLLLGELPMTDKKR